MSELHIEGMASKIDKYNLSYYSIVPQYII